MQRLLASSQSIKIARGGLVFEELEPLTKLYCIKKGACKFSKVDANGHEHILRFLGDGEVMGKRSVISNNGAKVNAVALTEIELCCLDKAEIQRNLQENTQFCQDFLDALVEDSNINEHTRIKFVAPKSFKTRLANLLWYLAEKFGTDNSGKLNLKIKRDDMAAVLGTSPEYIINLLKQFKELELIETNKRDIRITQKLKEHMQIAKN